MKTAIRCVVSGRVQGVYFRGSTREQAQQLGITGWAKNLPDGTVEVLACGTPDALQTLQRWLQRGPPMAHVLAVQCQPAPSLDFNDFQVL
jgi:acylphosphatase